MSTTAAQPIQYTQQHYNKQRGQYNPYQPAAPYQQSKSIPPLRVIQPAQLNNLATKSNAAVYSRDQHQQNDSGSSRTAKEVVSDNTGGLPASGGGPNNAMSMQRFCLRWNNHQTNLLSVFDQLLHDESFVDVTLAVEGQLLRAHKMVLSACSPYFQALFTSHPDKHPIVILKDVPYADMRSLLDFMYRGEVSVDQDRLTAFLRVAECLRIKGLTEVNEDTKPSTNNSDTHQQNTSSHHHNTSQQPSNLNYAQIQQHRLQHHQQQQLQAHIQQQHHQLQAAAAAAAAAAQQGKRFSVNHMLGGGGVMMQQQQQQQHQHQPKRKRGRPRKLSGSSTGGMDEFETGEESGNGGGGGQGPKRTGNSLVQGSPELLEVKMSVENFPTVSNASEGSVSDRERDNDRDDEDELVIATHSSPERGGGGGGSNQQQQGNLSRKEDTGGSCREDVGERENRVKEGGETIITTEIDQSIVKTEYALSTAHIKIEPPDNLNNNNNHPSTSQTPPNALHTPTINNSSSLITPTNNNNNSQFTTPLNTQSSGRQPVKRRARRRTSSSCQDPAEQLTEMSVRGLNLFRYASINEGIYHCTECAKVDVQKTFKNKYSFQRHAFLYHEGHQRKVFPCPVCQKEFSRPDKMKNHMKTVHDCFMPKDCVFPMGFFLPPSV